MDTSFAKGEIKVLHVDDEPQFLELVRRYFESLDGGLTVKGVTNPDRALKILEEGGVDCILSDYKLSSMDGLKLFKRVRKRHEHLPFILLTGKGSEEIASEAISMGVTDYIRKASSMENYELLANRIRNAVSRAESKRQREQTLERISHGFVAFDKECRFTYVNDRAAEVIGGPVGKSKEELIGSKRRGIYGDKEDRFMDKYEEAMGSQEPTSFEDYHPLLDKWFHVDIYPSETGLSIYFKDVTEQKQRTEALERYESIFNTVRAMIYIIDDEDRFLQINDTYMRVLGLPREEIEGRPVPEIVGSETFEEISSARQKMLDKGVSIMESVICGRKTTFYRVPSEEGYNLVGISITA